MFKRIKLTNFKAWRESGDVNLAPVTLLLGENSTGKSSLLQSLLLMKQTAISPDRTIHLNLGGDEANDYVDMGSFEDLLTHNPEQRQIRIEMDVEGDFGKRFLKVDYAQDSKKSPVVDELQLSTDNQHWFRAVRTSKGAFNIYQPNETRTSLKSREYAPERGISFSKEAIYKLGPLGGEVEDSSLNIRRELESISYLGPLRSKPKRTYVWNRTRPGLIGVDGSEAVFALLASNSTSTKNSDGLVESVSKWLKRMKIADKLEVKTIGSGNYNILVHRDGVPANLIDVGTGISQVLPVLVLAYFAPENSTIILEEPEIHLHPLAQSLLAELFVEVSRKRKVQFIVETHSEHLFRRMQTLVATNKAKPEQCALYFVERKNSDAVLKTLSMDKYGRLEEWPQNFFGDATGELRKQAQETMQRMKAERASQ
ncbi:AAA family ATPase [Vibrio sp. nBUS_14]|uniref:AAA family ATPase n=1 Tax=Vibrio sp. nBUS_14 TaxID=3395321 RepID=UPI003EB90F03